MTKRVLSEQKFEESKRLMPGGVSSPVRAFSGVGGVPPFISKAKGSHIWDIDGNEYIDYVGTWGPAILGHAHPEVIAALHKTIENGTSFGAPTELEARLAGLITARMPSIEMLRFVNSGTEATMSAIRLARGATGRPKIVKFEGCYHGHADSLLVKAGSGALTCGIPTSAGVTEGISSDTIVARYNNADAVQKIFSSQGCNIAAIIVEPVAGNMGCIPPASGFLEFLSNICKSSGALLIFDEVMTGFRVALGGAQEIYKIKPDITCLGKIVGGGLPVGAYGGSKKLMQKVAPEGPVYQAGTLSGNPLAMTAGIKTLELLQATGVYDELENKTGKLCTGIERALSSKGIEHVINRVGSMWSIFLTAAPVTDFVSAALGDGEKFRRLFHFLLDNGVYIAPSPFESAFMSLAHRDKDIQQTIKIFEAWAATEGHR